MGVCQHEKTAALNIEFKNSFDLNITQTIKPTFTARLQVIQCIDHVVMTVFCFFSKLVQRSSPYILVIIDGYLLKYTEIHPETYLYWFNILSAVSSIMEINISY